MGPARLFLAVWPTDRAVEDLMMLPRKDQPGVRFVSPENWHITLRFFGTADPGLVADAVDGSQLAALASPIVARLGPSIDVLGDRALIVGVQGIDELATTLRTATANIGEPPRRRFVGHLTVARLDQRVRSGRARLPGLIGAGFRSEFVVGSVALVESTLRPEGSRYETLCSWPVGL